LGLSRSRAFWPRVIPLLALPAAVATTALAPGAARAQAPARTQSSVRATAVLTAAYTDNLFQSYSERTDWVQRLSLDLDYGSRNRSAYYSAEAQCYNEYGDLFTQTHMLGVSVQRPGPERRLLAGGLHATVREGRRGYEYKDYVEAGGHGSAKLYLRPSLMLRAGSGLQARVYRHAGDFSYLEPTAYAQLSRFLPTRTTLMAGLDLGAKTYLRAAGDPAAGDSLAYVRTSDDDLQAVAGLWIKAAQSLADHTGLQLQYTRRYLLGGGTRYRRPEEYDSSEELFDDQYSRSSRELRTTLKHRSAAGIDLLLTARRARRRYEGRPALDLDGQPLVPDGPREGSVDRRDTRTSLLTRVAVDLTRYAPLVLAGLELRLERSCLKVDSNDPYYDATARTYSASLRLGL